MPNIGPGINPQDRVKHKRSKAENERVAATNYKRFMSGDKTLGDNEQLYWLNKKADAMDKKENERKQRRTQEVAASTSKDGTYSQENIGPGRGSKPEKRRSPFSSAVTETEQGKAKNSARFKVDTSKNIGPTRNIGPQPNQPAPDSYPKAKPKNTGFSDPLGSFMSMLDSVPMPGRRR